ncbi:MAG: 30S ribosomal protein S12 methylthiotransferase RimO [Bacteroidales bacterium]|nr:30S ribosomal protein S12 methylthiotransferase RimO [Bacteroidales bacterium]MCR5826943.1 30S ribosomal protein S12 methylthiotransferase RimO [Bacteroidales bacterium]
MKLQLITLGCSKNRVDSERLLRQFERAGVVIVPEEEPLDMARPDIVALNTCGFIQSAKSESIEAIFTVLEAKKRGLVKKVYVFGCLSQRYRKELPEEIEGVDGFFGANDAAAMLAAAGIEYDPSASLERHLTTPDHYAFLKISEGCDRSCSYCAIPSIRGRHVSVPMEDLVAEARLLADKGVKELLVIAQDTTFYGLDLYRKRMLGPLLQRLADIKGIEWIRIHYSYPADFPEDVLEIMAGCDKVCKYLDIPLQHSSSKVLSMMRRNIDGDATRALVDKFRKAVPGIVLRTTMIVGHPGEGVREFRDLLDFVREYRFERLGAFTYSEEENTYGALNFKDSVSPRVKQERYDTLMELQSGISLEYNESRVGTVERVLVDGFSDGMVHARSEKESVDVDGEILIPAVAVPAAMRGQFRNVKITAADEYDLTAQFI